jgi:hypothetical protein
MKPTVALAALLTVFAARSAEAQIFVSPFVDTTLSSPSAHDSASKPGFGVAFGTIGKIVGAETEMAYHPQLIDNTANRLDKNQVFTFSGNVLVGPTIGRVKPYGAIGAGDLLLHVTTLSSLVMPSPASISNNYFTVNVGGGVMGFVSTHLGVRADLRYFRAYGFKIADLETAGLALDRFDFWHASIGLAVKF